MKNIFRVLTFLAIGAFALTACDKEPELPYPGFDEMEVSRDFYIYNLSWVDDTINTVLPAGIASGWENTLKIANVRGDAKNVDLFIYFNNGSAWTGPYNIAAGITTFPASIDITGQSLLDAIDEYSSFADFAAGHQYAFGLRITTQENLVFETRSVIGGELRNMISTNIRNYPGANFIINLRAIEVCPVDMNDFIGTWTVSEWSDRFSAPDEFDVTITLDTDGQTLVVDGLINWLIPGGLAKISLNKSNPFAWVPSFDEELLVGTTGHPYDIRLLNNAEYSGTFASCDMEIFIGYEVGAYSVGGGLLGYFDWGKWTMVKSAKSNSNIKPRDRNYVEDIVSER